MPVVTAIGRYPVKSMIGETLTGCPIGPAGIPGDRAYALIDQTDGKVASAKNPRKWAALLRFRAEFVAEPQIAGPPPPVAITFPDGRQVRSDDPDVDSELSEALGRPVHLASAAPDDRSFEEVWPQVEGLAPEEFIEQTMTGREETGEPISSIGLGMLAPPGTFFDLTVLHLMTTATLRRLSDEAPAADFDVRRYRPNILIDDDAEGFPENGWVGRTLQLGDSLRAEVVMPTMRCVMTTLPQADLAGDRRTLRAIATANRLDIPGLGSWACAGVYANVQAAGAVRVGDQVGLAD